MERSRFYGEVPVVPKQAASVCRDRTYLQLSESGLTGRFHGELVACQPLHVASGALLPPESLGFSDTEFPLVKAFVRCGEDRIIPGSSFKGVFRSLVELFTASCICKTKIRNLQNNRECWYDSKKHKGELCPACLLFGAMGYQGKVRFTDGRQLSGGAELCVIPPQYKPLANPDYRRYYPHLLIDPRSSTWPLEVVPPGARFLLEGQFTNLTEGELGLLLIALGEGPWALCPKVGAGKSSGLGAIKIEGLQVEQLDLRKAYATFESAEAWGAVDVQACLDAAASLYRKDVLTTLQNTLACPCSEEG